MMFRYPEKHRTAGVEGGSGAFQVKYKNRRLYVIASHEGGWEHVSVSMKHRCPTWHEMAFVKNLFWSPAACVVQYHPAKADYVNVHPNCLHLWRSKLVGFPMPPKEFV